MSKDGTLFFWKGDEKVSIFLINAPLQSFFLFFFFFFFFFFPKAPFCKHLSIFFTVLSSLVLALAIFRKRLVVL